MCVCVYVSPFPRDGSMLGSDDEEGVERVMPLKGRSMGANSLMSAGIGAGDRWGHNSAHIRTPLAASRGTVQACHDACDLSLCGCVRHTNASNL